MNTLKIGQKWKGRTTARGEERTVQVAGIMRQEGNDTLKDSAGDKVRIRHKDTYSIVSAAKFIGDKPTYVLVKDVA